MKIALILFHGKTSEPILDFQTLEELVTEVLISRQTFKIEIKPIGIL